MLIHDIQIDKVQVKCPKRFDSFMTGKILYDGDRFIVTFRNVKMVSCKNANDTLYCQIKLGRDNQKFLLDLEEHIVDTTKENVQAWFKNKMNSDTVDEYFVSALTFSKKHNSIFKVRVDSPTLELDDSFNDQNVNITFRISSLRFLKTSFWVCYDILECEPANMFIDEDEDNKSVIGDDDDIYGPDNEEVERLRNRYIHLLQSTYDQLEQKCSRLKDLLEMLERNNFSLATFDAVENALSEIIYHV